MSIRALHFENGKDLTMYRKIKIALRRIARAAWQKPANFVREELDSREREQFERHILAMERADTIRQAARFGVVRPAATRPHSDPKLTTIISEAR